MSNYVLDASAVLALVHREPGRELVAEILSESSISAVNAAEVNTKLLEAGYEPEILPGLFNQMRLEVVAFSAKHSLRVGLLRLATKPAGLSLGDRACLATAELLGATAVTADRAWKKLRLPVKIKLIR